MIATPLFLPSDSPPANPLSKSQGNVNTCLNPSQPSKESPVMSLTWPLPQHADSCSRVHTHTHTLFPPCSTPFRLWNVHCPSCWLAVLCLKLSSSLLDLAYPHSPFSSQFPCHTLWETFPGFPLESRCDVWHDNHHNYTVWTRESSFIIIWKILFS